MTVTALRHSMRIMHADHGDIEIDWDPGKPDEVEHAQQSFEKWKGKGYWAYRLEGDGSRGEVIRDFDPSARTMVLAPRSQGG